jgi:hypothetical protein
LITKTTTTRKIDMKTINVQKTVALIKGLNIANTAVLAKYLSNELSEDIAEVAYAPHTIKGIQRFIDVCLENIRTTRLPIGEDLLDRVEQFAQFGARLTSPDMSKAKVSARTLNRSAEALMYRIAQLFVEDTPEGFMDEVRESYPEGIPMEKDAPKEKLPEKPVYREVPPAEPEKEIIKASEASRKLFRVVRENRNPENISKLLDVKFSPEEMVDIYADALCVFGNDALPDDEHSKLESLFTSTYNSFVEPLQTWFDSLHRSEELGEELHQKYFTLFALAVKAEAKLRKYIEKNPDTDIDYTSMMEDLKPVADIAKGMVLHANMLGNLVE